MFEQTYPILILMASITLLSGFVKGAVGFGMPMIMVSGLASFLPVETALATLIIPTVLGNSWQALRYGWRAAVESIRKYWIFLTALLFVLVLSAQLVRVVPQEILFLLIGVPIVFFALIQLFGWKTTITKSRRGIAEILLGSVAGFVGGISGVWGPPLVTYLTATHTPKLEQMRVQGVLYSIAAVFLTIAHLRSGVLNFVSAQLSLAMIVPAMLGIAIGFWVNDKMPQAHFRKATLIVLVLAGLNLIRRGLFG